MKKSNLKCEAISIFLFKEELTSYLLGLTRPSIMLIMKTNEFFTGGNYEYKISCHRFRWNLIK
ncbi:hypothetical protein GCM10019993_02840 [Enterococcus pseudoavium]